MTFPAASASASSRRDDLALRACEYALREGLIGLSLRPLAAELGTSDRMLLYHFGSKDNLIADLLRVSTAWSVEAVEALPIATESGEAVRRLWEASKQGQLADCQRLYVEASALGLLGRQPYVDVVLAVNERWMESLDAYFVAAGVARAQARRVSVLVDAAFMGLQLDLALSSPSTVREQAQAIEDVIYVVGALARARIV